jgi:signal transduction histidine kinase
MKALQSERLANESQKQMVKQEQLATLGLLSASVAHEINNPNQFVSVSAHNLEKRINDLHTFIQELMGEDTDPDISREFAQRFEGLHSQLALVTEGSQRIAGIVKGMRNNSRHDLGEAQRYDPVESLRTTLDLMRPTFSPRVTFEASGLENGYVIKGYAARLNQVFTNLIVNACHAIESKQQQSGDFTPGTVSLWTQSASGMLAIAIEDTGCGMTPEVKARLFEPFFTTKGADKGTGLGLGICRSIVEEHGGRLELESAAGRGTLFRVIVPVAIAEGSS